LLTNLPVVLIPLLMLNLMPVFRTTADSLATAGPDSTARHVQLGIGVLALSISAIIALRFRARRRASVPTPVAVVSGVAPDSHTSTPVSPPRDSRTDGSVQRRSTIRRLIDRANHAWDNGSLWVALLAGMSFLPAGPAIVLLVDTSIVASGAPLGAQIIAGVVFVLGMLAVFEVTLVSHLIAPAKTQAVLRPLHNWALAHRPQLVAAIVAVVGIWLVARGSGIV
jgi:hypothetical protein